VVRDRPQLGARPPRRLRGAGRARESVLDLVPLEVLRQYAVDVPGDLSALDD